MLNREEMKQEALKVMKKLDIYRPYIKGFKEKDDVCYFENYGGYWAWQEEKIQKKIKELEDVYGFVIYAVTHEFTEFGELYSFLYISKYKEDSQYNCQEIEEGHIVPAYVWNLDNYDFSEMGSIVVDSYGGGIRRIG
jgi:hypothetical protein